MDTNVLVYASATSAPGNAAARFRLQALASAGTNLRTSRQVLRDYLATLSRSQAFSHPVARASPVLDFQRFEGQFLLAEHGAAVTAGELKGNAIPSTGEGEDRAVRGPPAVVRKARQNFDPQLVSPRGVDD